MPKPIQKLQKFCVDCGKSYDDELEKCPICGDEQFSYWGKQKFCSKCGTGYDSNFGKCPKCGDESQSI
jgi:RNA polymerase subunit RPABC4/transcription elongation factor Spt4